MDLSRLHDAIPFEKHFRWRGREISRIEAFSDAVFAFSLTLLAVSLEAPRSYEQLVTALWGFPAFAVSFVLLMMVWYYHFIFFRRYGIQDWATFLLNSLLLFVVLFYVYPLKFLFAFLAGWFTEGGINAAAIKLGLNVNAAAHLVVIYGLGFCAIYGLLALLGIHAFRNRETLQLNAIETARTRSLIGSHLIMVTVGLISVGLALLMPVGLRSVTGGFAYVLLWPSHMVHGRMRGAREREALARVGGGRTEKEGAADSGERQRPSSSP